MNALYRFSDVRCKNSSRVLAFTLHAGETRLLQLASRDEKNDVIDCAIGENICLEGCIEIVQGERRSNNAAEYALEEREAHAESVPLVWQPLREVLPDRVGWVAPNGGLISNLRILENVTLPLWYHTEHEMIETERIILHWMGELGLEQGAYGEFLGAHPHGVELWQRKLAGLLRALLQQPRVLVVDAALFANIKESVAQCWIMALESYAVEGRAVLVVTDRAASVHWQKIE